MNDDDTQVGPDDETTGLPTAPAPTPDHLAWSLDDSDDEPQRRSWRSVWARAGAIVGGAAAIGIGVAFALWGPGSAKHIAPPATSAVPTTTVQAAPTTTTTTVAPPAPPPVTVTVTPTTPVPQDHNGGDGTTPTTPALNDNDSEYLRLVIAHGYRIENQAGALQAGHAVCPIMGQVQGNSPGQRMVRASEQLQMRYGITQDLADAVVGAAVTMFCPQYQ